MHFLQYLKLIFIACLFACTLPDNVDPKEPTDVPPETIFTYAQIVFVENMNGWNSGEFRSLVQYWAPTINFREYYNFEAPYINDVLWFDLYGLVLINFKEVKDLLNAQTPPPALLVQRANQVAIISLMEVYTYQVLVDTYGNVPYSEALMAAEGNGTPDYDEAETIYMDLLQRIDEAIVSLDDNHGSWGESDLIFGGDVTMWKKFGASLQLRIGMRLADSNPVAAQVTVERAVQHGVFDHPSQGAILHYPGIQPHVNPLYFIFIVVGRRWVPANTMIDLMNATDDPRLNDWFTLRDSSYRGAVYGLESQQQFEDFSHIAPHMLDPDGEDILIDYTEVEFLLAEAVERGFDVPCTAQEHYDNAIRASILYWGGTEEESNSYLAHTKVAYNTAPGGWRQKIGTQKWIALYNRSIESWAEWRRLDYPCWNVPVGLAYLDIPRRFPYHWLEAQLNSEHYHAAVAAMGGVDDHRQPVFWDVRVPSGCE